MNQENIIWIEGNIKKVLQMNRRGINNIYRAIISDEDNKEVNFNIANNGQSSSILELGSHKNHYSWIHYINTVKDTSITVDTFFKENNLDPYKYNFWNIDIQGAELLALKGASKSLEYANALYLEINEQEVYKNCGLVNEIDSLLVNYNFKRVMTSMTNEGWGDALYVKTT